MRLGKGVGLRVTGNGSGSPSFVLDDAPDAEIIHPFKVTAYLDGTTWKARIRAGTVNNLVPLCPNAEPLDSDAAQDLDLTDLNLNQVYIKASASSPPVFFPDTLEVVASTSNLSDTDTYGYLKIASVLIESTASGGRKTTVNQFVYASQVLVRAKPGTATALWSWSSR